VSHTPSPRCAFICPGLVEGKDATTAAPTAAKEPDQLLPPCKGREVRPDHQPGRGGGQVPQEVFDPGDSSGAPP